MRLEIAKKRIKNGNSFVYYSVYFFYKNDDITKLRRKVFFNAYKNKNILIRGVIYFYSLFIWPFNLIRQIATITKKRGSFVKDNYKKSYLKQISEQFYLGVLHTIPVRDYYNYQFYIKENREKHYEYLYNHEISYLFDYLSNFADKSILNDKYKFYQFCKKNDIPTIPVFELVTKNNNEIVIPNKSLFVKPRIGFAGKGISKWEYKDGIYTNNNGFKLNKQNLIKLLSQQSKKQDYIIQPVIEVNKRLSNFSKNALPTIRLISKFENENVKIIVAYQKVVLNKTFTDNNAFGFPINTKTGEMYIPNTNLHNDLKQKVNINEGNYLVVKENWKSIKEDVNKTHKLLKQYKFLAFDISISSKTPIIIEVNHNWDVSILQRVTNLKAGEMF